MINLTNKMTLRDLRASWEIPWDATDIEFDGKYGYNPYLKLSFRASSTWLSNFTRHVCDGILHRGYDPYHAVNVAHEVEGQRIYLIKHDARYFTYYSYSPDTPDTTWGNRCQPSNTGPRQIRVAQISEDIYEIRFDAGHHLWGEDCATIPCDPIDSYVRPIENFPLVVMGFEEKSPKEYLLVVDEFCLDLQADDDWERSFGGWISVDRWQYLREANIGLMIDDQPQDRATVSKAGKLVREGQEFHNGLEYCFTRDWIPGVHTMTLDILAETGKRDVYSWEFSVE
jgi:hypothetical protein